jgi:exopolyphosphatase/guanosine-5'-triphosphate,3'-diphosphate pyrophosphatase
MAAGKVARLKARKVSMAQDISKQGALPAAGTPADRAADRSTDRSADADAAPNVDAAGDANDRLAAIDIGSNSIRLVVACPLQGGQFRIIDEERRSTRLAHRLGAKGKLDQQSMDRTVVELQQFSKLVKSFDVTRLDTIATCAVREASNGEAFMQRVEKETGLKIRTISAEEEALYSFRSVQAAFDISDSNIAVADIGGGSTEIVYASAGHVEKIYSTKLGAVRLTERFTGSKGLFDDAGHLIRKHAAEELKDEVKGRPFTPQVLYGTGGTFTALASMIIATRGEDSQMIWGYRVTRADVRHLLDRLSSMSIKSRRSIPGLNADRADIIIAGVAIVGEVMDRLRTNILRVHTGGVRDGLLLEMTDSLRSTREPTIDPALQIEGFAVSCGADLAHAKHVAFLCGQIYDELAAAKVVSGEDREVLTAAAMLQDVGYLINYKQHHHHSYQLIVNSQLPGFRRHDLELIANVARYHRGARPKKKHANFRKLGKLDRRRVRQLAAILRIAGGLDRGHLQRVRSVSATAEPGRMLLEVVATGDPDLELWAARGRVALFERAFRRQLAIQLSDSESV